MRFSVSPRDAIPEEVRRINRMRGVREALQSRFGLSRNQAEFLAVLYRANASGMTRPAITEATGLDFGSVSAAFVRTRHLGVECDGRFYYLNHGLRAACALELRGEAVRAGGGR